jgi:peroxin-6
MAFFFSKSWEKSFTNFATLSSIVLVADSEEAYLAAAQTPNLLRQLLQDGRVLHQGDSFRTDNSLTYTLCSLEPVSQGLALAGRTEIVVLSPSHPIVFTRSDANNEPDFIEIDEGFLAASSETWQGKGQSTSTNAACVGGSEAPAYAFSTRGLDTSQDLREDNFSLYLRTPDLGKIGVLSHDWVCA